MPERYDDSLPDVLDPLRSAPDMFDMDKRRSREMGRSEQGLKIRRAVVGDSYVDRALAATTEFTRPLQDLVTDYCWGEVWARPGIDRRTRSIVNLGMLTALNRPNELRLHVRGAVANGLTQAEIGEILLQTAIYCGVPAAIDAFKVAQGVIAELDRGATSDATTGSAS